MRNVRRPAIPIIKAHLLHNFVTSAGRVYFRDFAGLPVGVILPRCRKLRFLLSEALNDVLDLVRSWIRLYIGSAQRNRRTKQTKRKRVRSLKHNCSISIVTNSEAPAVTFY